MAKTKSKQQPINRSNIKTLWTLIGVTGWEEQLRECAPEKGFQRSSSSTLKGLCLHPDHHDTEPSFYIYPDKGYAKCYGSSCGYYETNPLVVLSHIRAISLEETIRYVIKQWNPPFLTARDAAKIEADRAHQEMKQSLFFACKILTTAAAQNPLSPDSAWARASLEWLTVTRNIPAAHLVSLPIALLPDYDQLQRAMNNIYSNLKTAWYNAPPGNRGQAPVNHCADALQYFGTALKTPRLRGAIIFPQYASPSDIGRFKLRVPNIPGASVKEILMVDDPLEERIGLFGVGWEPYKPFFGSKIHGGTAYVTEGEFDVLSVMSKWLSADQDPPFALLAAGGTGAQQDIDPVLECCGITSVHLVGDAPDKGGVGVVKTWLRSIQRTSVRVFAGWEFFPGPMDLDEVAQHADFGLAKIHEVLWDKRADTFMSPWRWLFNVEQDTYEAFGVDDTRGKTEHTVKLCEYLPNKVDCKQFTDLVSDRFDIDGNTAYRDATARGDTVTGFVVRLHEALREIIIPAGTRARTGAQVLVCYNRINHVFHEIVIDSERSAIQELTPVIGLLHTYITDVVGWPPFLEPIADADPATYTRVSNTLRGLLRDAILLMAKGAISLDLATRRRQGYFRIAVPDTSDILEVVVCGTDIFQIRRHGANADTEYIRLENPTQAGVFFDIGYQATADAKPWYPGGLSAALLQNNVADVKRLYEDLEELYTEGFLFRNHELTCTLLAGLLISFPVCDAFTRPPVVLVTGETSSGKTYLASTMGPVGPTGIRILFQSQGSTGYTMASATNMMDCDGRLTILDEFERNDQRGNQIQLIAEMLRGITTGVGDRTKMGVDGQMVHQYFRLPVVMLGIQGADKIQDINRLLIVNTQKKPYAIEPHVAIFEKFDSQRLDRMRRELNLGMYAHAQTLHEYAEEIRNDFHNICKRKHFRAEVRWASGIFPVLAIMKFIGRDYEEFLAQYVKVHEFALSRVESHSESAALLSVIMHNAHIQQVVGPNMSIAQLLIDPLKRQEINSAGKNIYLDEETNQLLLLNSTIANLIPQFVKQNYPSSQHVQTLLERHPTYVEPHIAERSRILVRVGRYIGGNVKITDVTVLNIESWLHPAQGTTDNVETESKEDVDQLAQQVTGGAATPTGTERRDDSEPTDW